MLTGEDFAGYRLARFGRQTSVAQWKVLRCLVVGQDFPTVALPASRGEGQTTLLLDWLLFRQDRGGRPSVTVVTFSSAAAERIQRKFERIGGRGVKFVGWDDPEWRAGIGAPYSQVITDEVTETQLRRDRAPDRWVTA